MHYWISFQKLDFFKIYFQAKWIEYFRRKIDIWSWQQTFSFFIFSKNLDWESLRKKKVYSNKDKLMNTLNLQIEDSSCLVMGKSLVSFFNLFLNFSNTSQCRRVQHFTPVFWKSLNLFFAFWPLLPTHGPRFPLDN